MCGCSGGGGPVAGGRLRLGAVQDTQLGLQLQNGLQAGLQALQHAASTGVTLKASQTKAAVSAASDINPFKSWWKRAIDIESLAGNI